SELVDRPYERVPEYVEVERYDEEGDRVVTRYFYDDDYDSYRYRKYFSRFHFGVGFYSDPWLYAGHGWDPYWHDPYYYSGWAWSPYWPHRYSWYRPIHHHHYYAWAPGYRYTYGGHYTGWWYDSPYTVRRGNYAPRGTTIG